MTGKQKAPTKSLEKNLASVSPSLFKSILPEHLFLPLGVRFRHVLTYQPPFPRTKHKPTISVYHKLSPTLLDPQHRSYANWHYREPNLELHFRPNSTQNSSIIIQANGLLYGGAMVGD